MNLEADTCSGGEFTSDPFGVDAGTITWHINGPVVLGSAANKFFARRMDHHDDVVHDLARGGDDLVGLDPFVFREGSRDDVGLVRHDSRGLDGVSFAEGDNGIGFSDTPFTVERQFGRGVGWITQRTSRGINPREQVSLILGRERAVVRPRAGAALFRRRGEPRWHGAFA